MRPVNRGHRPLNKKTGQSLVFKNYRKYSPYLKRSLGTYCSFCERRISDGIAIEHIQSKDIYPELICEWDNFLLSCRNCNSTKGQNDCLNDCYWPDRDNTAALFDYQFGGIIKPKDSLTQQQKEKAERTLKLTGLNRGPGNDRDLRWADRIEFFGIAIDSLETLHENPTDRQRKRTIKQALGTGCWSIWMTVFRDEPDMLKRFIEAFPGTRKECFDDRGQPLPLFDPDPEVQDETLSPETRTQEPEKIDVIVSNPPYFKDNPSLRQIPRYEPAEVLPVNRETSILDWLLASGRLIPRDDEESSIVSEEEDLDVLEEDFLEDDEIS